MGNSSRFLLIEFIEVRLCEKFQSTVVYLQLEDSKRDYVKSIDSLQSEKDDLNNKLKKASDGK